MQRTIIILIIFLLAGCARPHEEALRSLLMEQQEAWNRGDIDHFMEGYLKSDSLRFVSADGEVRGWQATLERYHRAYPDHASRGILTFDIKEIKLTGRRHAFIYGGYTLERATDRPTGLYTLVAQHTAEGWRIIHDHTSRVQTVEVHTVTE